jgi:RNA polymerase sigma-70 factor, ECF subfamily
MEMLEQIWIDHRDGLLSFIRCRVSDKDLAEDILQDVILKVHSRLSTLNNAERMQSWLYQITRHTVIDFYRRHRITESLPEDLLQQQPEQEDEWWQILGKCIHPMMELLPDRYREALILSEIHGLPLKTVAARLSLSLPGAKSRVQRGRAKLKQVYLDCCQIEVDRRGNPVDWSSQDCCRGRC